jgi:glycine/D-amino acid oxidase-like deaminating enzyme
MLTPRDIVWFDGPGEMGPTLWGNQEADVAVVGGGFTGLAAAYFIKQRFPKKRIIVLEAEHIGFGSSSRNSGGVSGVMGHNYYNQKTKFGTEKMLQLQPLIKQSFALVEQLVAEHGIKCDYERIGRLLVAETDRQAKRLEDEYKAAKEAGARIEWFDRKGAREQFGCLDILAAVRYPDEGVMDPVKFVRGMKQVVTSLGVEVYEHSRCMQMVPGTKTSPKIFLYTNGGCVHANDVVLATNAYRDPLNLFSYKVLPFYIYNIATEPLSKAQLDAFQCPSGRGNVFGTTNMYWARRITADNRVNFAKCDAFYFYNIDKDYSHNVKEFQNQYNLMVKKFPFLKGIRMTHAWGGLIGITLDFLPFVGCAGKHRNIYYSLGYNGCGLAPAQLAGKMIAAMMAGEKSDLTENILINRKPLGVPSALLTYLGSNAYKLTFKVEDWLLSR